MSIIKTRVVYRFGNSSIVQNDQLQVHSNMRSERQDTSGGLRFRGIRSSIARFLSEHPDALVKCNTTPALYEYCQEHYEIAWNSGTKQFSEYTAAP